MIIAPVEEWPTPHYDRHWLNGYLDQRAPSSYLASSSGKWPEFRTLALSDLTESV